MYRILVVDDEPYIVDSVSAMLQDMEEIELDVYPAYSAKQALGMLELRKYDIVFSDIQMPGMTGLEMQEKINILWPRCKMIFLTGFDHFDYIQSAMKQGASNYILKTDGPEEIKAALLQLIDQINHELENNEILYKAKQQFQIAKPMLKKDLLTLISSEECSLSFREERFAELELDLHAGESLLCVVGQVDEWQEDMNMMDRSLLLYAVQNIAQELLEEGVRFESVVYNDAKFAWFLQPKENSDNERMKLFVEENIDAIQRNCRSLLHLSISVALHRELVDWEELSDLSVGLQQILFRGGGNKEEMVLYLDQERNEKVDNHLWKVRGEFNKFANVVKHFENNDKLIFCDVLKRWMDGFMKLDDHIFAEAYYKVATFFMSYINRLKSEDGITEFDVKRLLNIDSFASREVACQFLLATAKQILNKEEEAHEKSSESIVLNLNKYIEQNLDGDLSLIKLAEITHFNPQYLSRLYKQVMGIGLSDKILELRLIEAKRLLETTNMKIQDIATNIGFQSAPYFTRFFKKQTSLTPQEYRQKDLTV